ncbi:MAG: hypothetical protein Kow0089_02580 [Desulfobulbaceae bacterium]
MTTPKEIKSLKEKMLALQSGDYDVEAENPRVVRCWERLNCDKTDCPAYGRLRCWSIAGTCCHGEVTGKFAQKIKDCRECVVYRESCGDEIGELIETFNLMVKEVKHDVAERVRSNEERARTERLSEIGDMVAGVAHETRNPLHSIGLATSFLRKKYRDALMNEFLGIIEEEVKKLSRLTSVFLDFSNPTPLRIGTCDLNRIVDDVVAGLADEAGRRDVAVTTRLDAGLPELRSDRSRLEDLVAALLENALEASEAGMTVTVETTMAEGAVRVAVGDEGPGIPETERERIFRPFYTTKVKGPGLGLAIVQRVVHELGGTVRVDDNGGKGALFTVILPLQTGVQEEEKTE